MCVFLYFMAESVGKVIKAAPDEDSFPSPLKSLSLIFSQTTNGIFLKPQDFLDSGKG